jgi:hypothetical protein
MSILLPSRRCGHDVVGYRIETVQDRQLADSVVRMAVDVRELRVGIDREVARGSGEGSGL